MTGCAGASGEASVPAARGCGSDGCDSGTGCSSRAVAAAAAISSASFTALIACSSAGVSASSGCGSGVAVAGAVSTAPCASSVPRDASGRARIAGASSAPGSARVFTAAAI